MSTINRHNYEAYFLDYLEGNLNAEDTVLLMQFLKDNPDLKSEAEGIELIELKADEGIRFDKASLRQNINEDNVEDYIIASVENVIDEEDETELEEYLKGSTEAMVLADRYKKTILSKPEINYPEKSRLKKNSVVIRYIAPLTSAAAAIAIILFLVNPFSGGKTDSAIADKQTHTHKKTNIRVEKSIPEMTKSNSGLKTEKEMKMAESLDLMHQVKTETINKQSDSEKKDFEKEPVTMNKLEPKSINTIHKNQQQSIAITGISDISDEIADNTTQPVENTQQNTENNPSGNRRVNLWGVAEIGVKVFGKLNERKYTVEPDFSKSGQLKSITLTTEQRKITTPAI